MDRRTRAAFLTLIVIQAAHSIEEYAFSLWEVWPIARWASGLLSDDLPTGFAILNGSFIVFGVWSYLGPVRSGSPSASTLAWIWVAVGLLNGVGHPAMAVNAGGYFPGLVTAPLLLLGAIVLAALLLRRREHGSS